MRDKAGNVIKVYRAIRWRQILMLSSSCFVRPLCLAGFCSCKIADAFNFWVCCSPLPWETIHFCILVNASLKSLTITFHAIKRASLYFRVYKSGSYINIDVRKIIVKFISLLWIVIKILTVENEFHCFKKYRFNTRFNSKYILE